MQKHDGSVISDGMDSVLIRYHEIALKKGNRAYFTEMLKQQLLAAVKDLGAKEIRSLPARLLLTFKNDVPAATLIERMSTVSALRISRLSSAPRETSMCCAAVYWNP